MAVVHALVRVNGGMEESNLRELCFAIALCYYDAGDWIHHA